MPSLCRVKNILPCSDKKWGRGPKPRFLRIKRDSHAISDRFAETRFFTMLPDASVNARMPRVVGASGNSARLSAGREEPLGGDAESAFLAAGGHEIDLRGLYFS